MDYIRVHYYEKYVDGVATGLRIPVGKPTPYDGTMCGEPIPEVLTPFNPDYKGWLTTDSTMPVSGSMVVSDGTDADENYKWASNGTPPPSLTQSLGEYVRHGVNSSTIQAGNLYTTGVTKMQNCFYASKNLKGGYFANWDFSSVTNMSGFLNLGVAPSEAGTYNALSDGVNFGSADFSSVTDMGSMFYGAANLKLIDFSNCTFGTTGKTVSSMFCECGSLKEIRWPSGVIMGGTSLTRIFNGCYSLTTVDLSPFATTSASNFAAMFSGCTGLKNVDLSGIRRDTSTTARVFSSMFYECTSLETINMDNFYIRSNDTITNMFAGCEMLNTIYARNLYNSYTLTMIQNALSNAGLTSQVTIITS